MKTIEIQKQSINHLIEEKGANLEEYKDIKIVTYDSEIRGSVKPCFKIWKGRQSNPFANYYSFTNEDRQKAINKYKESADSRVEWKEERRKERQEATNKHVKVGDIFVASWGYEQTNVDSYQVIDLVGKSTVVIRQIANESIEGSEGFMSDTVKPVKDAFIEGAEPFRKRLTSKDWINLSSYKGASKWDGQKRYYRSWYA